MDTLNRNNKLRCERLAGAPADWAGGCLSFETLCEPPLFNAVFVKDVVAFELRLSVRVVLEADGARAVNDIKVLVQVVAGVVEGWEPPVDPVLNLLLKRLERRPFVDPLLYLLHDLIGCHMFWKPHYIHDCCLVEPNVLYHTKRQSQSRRRRRRRRSRQRSQQPGVEAAACLASQPS
jgi:hypothetical protein